MLLKHFSIEDFKDTFPLASFGARVCYSDKDIDQLLSDPRITDKQRRAEFLSKLANNKHFSVFSHSFRYKYVGESNALRFGATYFKSRYNPVYPGVIGISLRHYLEELLNTNPEQFQNEIKQLAEYDTPLKIVCEVSQVDLNREGQDIKVYLLHINTNYDGYAVFYIDGISRVATHQLVRHSTLNFSQRSQRYVKEDDNYSIIPPSIAKDPIAKDVFVSFDNLAQNMYNILVKYYSVKREDARFILPSGRKTSIVVSGTLNWIKDIINKRNTPHAQWEIRDVVRMMQEAIDCYFKLRWGVEWK
ncbi:MAG: FAD-dependent thymidylate synthase [Sulfurihydrogenibium sp.]|jgi:thymidylate synthase (FAD)|nr:FAD-dependent thymidylate synthase [Sulfurihydrogenibium sp.]